MTHRKRLASLVLVLSVVSLAVGGIAIVFLYRAAFEEVRARLVETAQSQARLIDAMVRFDRQHILADHAAGAAVEMTLEDAVLSQITDAHHSYIGFGETGEFVLARKNGDEIEFLLDHRHDDFPAHRPIPWKSDQAEPMRRALLGMSGIVVERDYRDIQVLAAYEPVRELDLGIVVKIDLAEIRAPFARAAAVGLLTAVFVIFLGARISLHIGNPLIEELRDLETQTRAIVETTVEAIVTMNDSGIVEYFNPAAEKLFGYPSEEAIGKSIDLLMPPNYRNDHVASIRRYLETGESAFVGKTREVEGKHKDGTVFPIYLAVSELHLGGRRLFTGIIHDLTRRKRAEEEKDRLVNELNQRNRELECLYRCGGLVRYGDLNTALFEQIASMIYEAIEHSGVTGARITFDGHCYTSAVFNETTWALSTPITAEERPRGLIEAFLEKDANEFEDRQAIEEGNSLIMAIAWVLGEAIERKEAEAKVIHASTLASIGELAAGVGHEINNPINGIINCADILIPNTPENSKDREFAQMIRSEAERIATIVRNLLTFSRQERQKHSPARLCDIVESVLTLCRKKIQKSHIDLEVDIPKNLPKLHCRSEQIQQVLMNLIINSMQALDERHPGPTAGKLLSIKAMTKKIDDHTVIRLTVEDQGSGIAPAHMDRIFDPFYTTKGRDKGTGLGLSVSDGIVKSHNGTITVESEQEKFTRFCVDLPIPDEYLVNAPETSSVSSASVNIGDE